MKRKLKIYYQNDAAEFCREHQILMGQPMVALIRRAVTAALDHEEFPHDCELSVTLTGNEEIRDLNRDYRGKDAPTDVLSFPILDFDPEEDYSLLYDEGPAELGDIVISVEKAMQQAGELGHSTEREIIFLCVHSVLHLLGYDHETSNEDEEEMFQKQREIMKRFN